MKISIITPTIRPKGLAIIQKSLAQQTVQDFEWLIDIGIPSRGYDLNKALNRLLKRARGEWIVMWQDYIKAPPDALKKFLEVADPKKFITGACGKTLNWKDIKWDWRANRKSFEEIEYYEWEADFAIVPLKAFYDIGGYDEEYDQYWSNENVNTACRAKMLGYTFWVLPNNQAIHFDHDKVFKHPFRHTFNPDFHNKKLDDIKIGIAPIKLPYLNNT